MGWECQHVFFSVETCAAVHGRTETQEAGSRTDWESRVQSRWSVDQDACLRSMAWKLRFLRAHCHAYASGHQVFHKKKRQSTSPWPAGARGTEPCTLQSGGPWHGYVGQRPQMTQTSISRTTIRKNITTCTVTNGTPRKCWGGTAITEGGVGDWSRWNTEDHEEAPLVFPEPVLAWFFLKQTGLGTRERNVILGGALNRYHLDLVGQVMKI